ncbi:DUF1003 domain-containing protein [Piscinibacter terrae]|uniref:DUF1003 domain-containing protein n=1 Tax=Piscinibacter terrae TaxID=2496871 RepID=A0A3N7HMS4_9BURK|nr:DUF1003 domain-containing protein [Albitalea terrae]RQP23414.1 DUF1003 domain-containing protein [Albitalea terrae]
MGTSPQRQQRTYRHATSVDELTRQNVQAIVDLEHAARLQRSLSQRMANAVASFCGTMTFVWLHVGWFGLWIGVNTWPGIHHVDGFPFTFLTLMVSLEAIFLSAFILIAQNEETRLAERRNALDLQINLLTEQENTKMLQMLAAIGKKLDVCFDDDPSLSVLEQATRPDKLAEQIERASGQDADSQGGH